MNTSREAIDGAHELACFLNSGKPYNPNLQRKLERRYQSAINKANEAAIARLRKEIELAKRKSKYGNPTPLWRDVELLCDYVSAIDKATDPIAEPQWSQKRDWVDCPICKQPDMRREQDNEGNAIIYCTNHACRSNGGNYDADEYL